MINTTRKPTETDIATKARLLYRVAHLAAEKARTLNYDNMKESIDEFADFAEAFEDASRELHILIDVYTGFSAFTDFPECSEVSTNTL